MNNAVPLRERVLSAAAASPSMTRPEGRRLGVLLLFLSVAIAATLFVVAGGPSGARDHALALRGAIVRGWAAAACAFACLVLGRGRSTVVRQPQLLVAATWASPVVMLLWVVRFDGDAASFADAATGMALGLAVAVTPLASFLSVRRGAEPRYPGVLGGAAGALCGAWAQVIVLMWHPFRTVVYAVVAHVVPLVALAALGRLAGGRMLAAAGAPATANDSSRKYRRNLEPVSTWSSWKDIES
jgi:hypothetical protein